MAKKVGSVYAEIRARLDKFERDLKRAHGQTRTATNKIQKSIDRINFRKFSRRVDRVALAWVKLTGVLAGAGAVGGFIRIGAEYEDTVFRMSRTFQGETDRMIAKAQEMANRFQFYYDFNDISYAFTKTADSMQRYGITGDKYIRLVERAADIGAAKNLQLKESVDRIESAMRGEAEASEFLGLTLNDTYLKNIAFNGALKDTWEKMSDLEKSQNRFNELMNQSVKFVGSAEQAANTFNGALQSLGKAIKDRLNQTLLSSNSILTSLIKKLRELWTVPAEMSRFELLKKQQEDLIKRQESLNAAIKEIARSKTPGKQQYLDRLFQKLGLVQDKLALVGQELYRFKKQADALDAIAAPQLGPAVIAPAGSGAGAGEKPRPGGLLGVPGYPEDLAAQWEKSFADIEQAATKSYTKVTSNLASTYETVDRRIQTTFSSAGDALAAFVTGGKIRFKDFAASLIADLARIQSRMLLSGLMGSFVGAFAPSYAPAHVGAGGTTAFKFHRGGHLGEPVAGVGQKSGRSYEFNANETVVPDGQLGSGAGGNVTVYNISAMDAASFVDFARRTGAVPMLAAENLDANGLLRKAVLENL